MKKLDLEQFNTLLESASVKPRLKSELRFVTSTAHIKNEDWQHLELLAITDRSGNKGVLLISIDSDAIYVLPCEFSKGITSSTTGRAQPVICDFCMTWQSGSKAGSILFTKTKQSPSSVGYLCCGDLACSKHVRTLTPESRVSRAQLREDLTNEQRVARLKKRLHNIMDDVKAAPISTI